MTDDTQPAPMDAATIESCASKLEAQATDWREAAQRQGKKMGALVVGVEHAAKMLRALDTLPARQPAAITLDEFQEACVYGLATPEETVDNLNTRLNLRGAVPSADTEALTAEVERLRSLLVRLEPHLEAIVCYASDMGEHEPNRLVVDVRAALNPASMETGR